MRQRSTRITALLVGIATVVSLTLVDKTTTPSAHAAVQQTTSWPATIDMAADAMRELVAHPDGGVSSFSCKDPVTYVRTSLMTYDAKGREVNGSSGTDLENLDLCRGNIVAGKGGAVYGVNIIDRRQTLQIVAIKANRKVWSRELHAECAESEAFTPIGMAAGPNGDIYALVRSLGRSCDKSTLIGLTPAGKVKFTKRLGANHLATGGTKYAAKSQLRAYRDGLVLVQHLTTDRTRPIFRYFDFAGGELPKRHYSLRLQVSEGVRDWDVSYEGTIFVATSRTARRQAPCQNQDVTERIFRRTTAGSTLAYNLRSHCMVALSVKAAPGGGAVVAHEDKGFTATHKAANLFLLQKNGAVKPIDVGLATSIDKADLNRGVSVGINGNILFWRDFLDRNSYRSTELIVLSAGGQVTARRSTSQLQPTATSTRYRMIQETIAPSNGVVYAAMCTQEHGLNWCRRNRGELHQLPFVDAGFAYPQGLIAGLKPSAGKQLLMAAVGDSFMAALGNEPYEARSVKSDCNRSDLAYARQLGFDPAIRVRLEAFVACSGATTADVINGKGGEPSQLESLNRQIDVVILSIGGNDIEFANLAFRCATIGCNENSAPFKESLRLLGQLPDNLSNALRKIRQRVRPDTAILLVGYPDLAPPPESGRRCLGIETESEARTIRRAVAELGRVQATTVGSLRDANTRFVDMRRPDSPFVGKDLCSDDSYFFGYEATGFGTSFHPDQDGQKGYKKEVRRYL